MSDDQNNGENQEVTPKTGKQVALWLQRGRMQLAKRKSEAKSAPETEIPNAVHQAAAPEMTAPAAAPTAPRAPVTKGKVAAFLWMPQIHLSLQAFSFPLALMVQTFAQILVTVGLLPTDHPARSYTGAKSYGITQLLEEARAGLPPVRTLWGDGTRILATRQYAIFASTIGVLATGAMTLFTMFTQIFFGFTQAFAQSPYNRAGDFSIAGDLGIGFINAIFDPTGSSVTSSGLGELFRIYSSAMLIFAGIIVLWIIVSAVAETARTGIPFGKQFNHVWAPIRLVVALGLLIPLGSGLNSGQHLVIYLTQWGSEQANMMWVTFADRTTISGSASGNSSGGGAQGIPGALTAVPVTKDDYRAVSDQLFDAMLCQKLWNDYAGKNGLQPINGYTKNTITSTDTTGDGAGVASVDGQTPKSKNQYVTNQFAWKNPQMDCGNINFTRMVLANTDPDAAAKTTEDMLKKQEEQLDTYIGLAQPTVNELANAAIASVTNTDPNYNKPIQLNPLDFYGQYRGVADAYAAARVEGLKDALIMQNQLLGQNFKEDAEKRGWVSAPVWLNKIAEQNGKILDAARELPRLSAPPENSLANYDLVGNAWNRAQDFLGNARKETRIAQADPTARASALMQETFRQILQPSSNPLGTISGYGRSLMGTGVEITFASSKTMDKVDENGNIVRDQNNEAVQVPATCRSVFECDPPRPGGNTVRQNFEGKLSGAFGGEEVSLTPGNSGYLANEQLNSTLKSELGNQPASIMRPLGTMLISFGFMAGYVLPLLPFFRFMLGVLGWVLLLFEAILAVPLLALSLLKTDGEGFMTQNFQTGAVMILALIIRPMLMIFGLLLGLIAFNGIMNIASISFLAAADPDNSVLSAMVYLIMYGMLAYTLANSAFKAIDILPNQVMSWLGARLDQRVDDASVIHQQSSAMVQNLGMVSAMGGASAKVRQAPGEGGTL